MGALVDAATGAWMTFVQAKHWASRQIFANSVKEQRIVVDMADVLEVSSQEVRLPQEAVEALAQGRPVSVTRYGHPQHVVLSRAQYALVAPLLELLQEGANVSPELLMTKDDVELMRQLAEDPEPTEAERLQIEQLLGEQE